jgi:hypothetical protein
MCDEMGRTWKEAIITYIKAPSWHLQGGIQRKTSAIIASLLAEIRIRDLQDIKLFR